MQGLLSSGLFDLARRLLPAASLERGLDESIPEFPVTRFEANGSEWVGQVFNLGFPTRLKISPNESVDGIRLRYGTSREFIQTNEKAPHSMLEASVLEDLDLDLVRPSVAHDGGTQVQSNEASVSIQQGNSFIAVLEFL
jgi:hypothetical protein